MLSTASKEPCKTLDGTSRLRQTAVSIRLTSMSPPSSKAARASLCSELIAVALLLALTLGRLNPHLFVVLLQGGKVLTSLAEFTLLHSFPDIPMNKGTLGVHQVELGVDP